MGPLIAGAERLDVLYDGDCAFCVRVLRLVRRADRSHAFRWIDTARGEWRAQFPSVRPEDAANAMLVVTASGEVFSGFYAFRRMLWASPWLLPLIVVFYCPGASLVGPRLYGWIARNRRRFGCRVDACDPLDRR
jgi:predicted DCC family thiol-disulfide oxidoreductase YuxK